MTSPEFDARLSLPGLHRVARVVQPPPELADRLVDDSFWLDPVKVPAGLTIV